LRKVWLGEEGLQREGLVGGKGVLHVGKEMGTFSNGMQEVARGVARASASRALGVQVEVARSCIEGQGGGGLGVCREVEAHESGA
jgi:hypothetical protein